MNLKQTWPPRHANVGLLTPATIRPYAHNGFHWAAVGLLDLD
jgi:hypothetical protein